MGERCRFVWTEFYFRALGKEMICSTWCPSACRVARVAKVTAMELSVDISYSGQAVSCKMNLQHPVHQMNALSHLGFLIQMYISHLDDLGQLHELQQLKQQKYLVESMHRNAREQVAATHPTAEAAQEKRVNFADSSDLPKCHLDLRFLRDDHGDHGDHHGDHHGHLSHSSHSPSSPSCTSPSPSASAATVFRLKSFVIPRMKSRLSGRRSLTPGGWSGWSDWFPESPGVATARSEPGVSFRDWGVGEESW